MKIRTGFISNSSSTSFIIAIKPIQTKEQEMILSALKISMRAHKTMYCESLLKDYIEQTKDMIKDAKKEIKHGKEHLEKILPYQNSDICIYIYNIGNHSNSLSGLRYTHENPDPNCLSRHIETIENQIKSKEKYIEDLQKRVDTLNELPIDTQLIHFDKDNWDRDSIKTSLEEGEKFDVIKIVEVDVT